MSTLVLIDGPNLLNDVDRYLTPAVKPEPNALRQYFLRWFDIDRLVHDTIGQTIPDYRLNGLGVVVFHSEKPLGRSSVRIAQPEADRFWGRQASGPGTSTVLVTVPGTQAEKTINCPHCSKEHVAEVKSEKGVDTSMVTYLYEALDQWDRAVLFTNDADFVPPVQALRRRGKRVFVAAAETEAVGALRRACQTFFPISGAFLERDYFMFRMLEAGGLVDQTFAAVEKRYGTVDVRFTTDGDSCPMFLLPTPDENLENALAGPMNAQGANVTWFPSTKGREGRILSGRHQLFGQAVIRHRGQFTDAAWLARWSDDPR